ncbi:hypothetical protein CIPAW_08G113800 [Carya illinoinensis]|uniref:Uncharacterized protein n=1 Tax=Carya illinoinensis TaxID=32201 RepID=A0A8T1PQM2_CARIL|nr:hypothetical protein CIPAW_08G113800 [Carya illinoinensis]KAG6645315.1 hypothetical protein CIPAW_08G113800 [Carya illinoinensis]
MNSEIIKETACLETCNQHREIGALRNNIVEEADGQERGNEPYVDEQPSYFPPELVGHSPKNSNILYHYYLMELEQKFDYEIPVHDIVLVLRNKLEAELGSLHFDLDVGRGSLTVNLKYVGVINLSTDQVLLCRSFQKTLLRVLIHHDFKSLNERMDGDILGAETDYLLLPATGKHQRPEIIDWHCVNSVLFSCKKNGESHWNCSLPEGCARIVQTKDGPVCTCLLQNSLVYTRHSDRVYCTMGILALNANSRMQHRCGKINTYKEYYEERHGIKLCFEHESWVSAKPLFRVKKYLQRCRNQKKKESSMMSVELPPELCSIIMSPMSINTFYSFSFVPSIMHRLESLLIAANLKKMHLDHCTQNDVIPISKVLEAITTKKCQETFDLESLETLGDSFLKYAVSQQLFKTYQDQPEGVLTSKKEKIISNAALCKFGCHRKLPGFIRDESFDPKKWIIPGDRLGSALSEELLFNTRKIYIRETRKMEKSLAGAILVDSGYNKEMVFGSIRPLLEPLMTPETPMSHPVKELTELCQKEHYKLIEINKNRNDNEGRSSITVKVDAKGLTFEDTATAANGKTARKLAYKKVLKSLKDFALHGNV